MSTPGEVEQGPDPVVPEAGEPERDPLDALDQVVGRFGRPVRHVGVVPGGDLVLPARSGCGRASAPRPDTTRLGGRGRDARRTRRPRSASVWSYSSRTTSFACQRCGPRPWVAGGEQPEQPGAAVVVEAFIGSGQQPPAADRADRPCGPDGRGSRSGHGGGTRRASGWPASPHGTDRRPGRRRAASCRTPSDTGPTDPTSPTGSGPATASAAGGQPAARLDRVCDQGRHPAARPARTSTIEVDHRC